MHARTTVPDLNDHRAFTLVELLVVMAIIIVMVGLGVKALSGGAALDATKGASVIMSGAFALARNQAIMTQTTARVIVDTAFSSSRTDLTAHYLRRVTVAYLNPQGVDVNNHMVGSGSGYTVDPNNGNNWLPVSSWMVFPGNVYFDINYSALHGTGMPATNGITFAGPGAPTTGYSYYQFGPTGQAQSGTLVRYGPGATGTPVSSTPAQVLLSTGFVSSNGNFSREKCQCPEDHLLRLRPVHDGQRDLLPEYQRHPATQLMRLFRADIRGFSLVEVVLAVGVTAFALVAIFSLFSVSLQSNASSVDQIEALSATKALPAFLAGANSMPGTPSQQGFPTVYGWLASPSNPSPTSSPPGAPLIYAYNVASVSGTSPPPGVTGQSVVLLKTDPTLTSSTLANAPSNRQGRLFGVYLTVSPNFPVGSVVNPTPGTLALYSPASAGSPPYPEGALGVQVKVYAVPQVGLGPAYGAYPVLIYDLTVPR